MKNILKISFALVLSFVSLNTVLAQRSGTDSEYVQPRYTLTVMNVVKAPVNTITFDVYMKHTNPDSTPFIYGAGQYFFTFNPTIGNGGTLSYATIGTDLPTAFVPVSASISGNILRLASNLPGLPSTSPTIRSDSLGTKIVRMRLRTTATAMNNDTLLLEWRNSENPFTKIAAFTGLNNEVLVDITTPSTHTILPYNLVGIEEPNMPISMQIPTEYALSQNFPNPFNPTTKIDYALPVSGKVQISIYDVTGRQVMSLVNTVQSAGFYSVNFDGSNLASGMYFYRIGVVGDGANDFQATKRMILIK